MSLRHIHPINIADLKPTAPSTGEPIFETVDPTRRVSRRVRACCIVGCERSVLARDLCSLHYKRFRKYGDPLAGGAYRPEKGDVAAFIATALASDQEECIRWPFSGNGLGYGVAVIDGAKQYVHRYVCAQVNGPPPKDNSQAAHSCGNGHEGCINPRHLSWKSPLGNSADQAVHGTRIRGARVGSAKVTPEMVRAMRSKIAHGVSQKRVAAEYGLHPSSVSMIATGKNWAWLR